MKQITILLCMLIGLTSYAQTLLLTEDTILDGNQIYTTVRTNGNNLIVNGRLTVTAFIMLNDGGHVFTTDDLTVSGDVFFLEDNGTIQSAGGIIIGGDLNGVGNVIYCSFLSYGILGADIKVLQNCTLSIKEYVKGVKINEPYIIYNSLGQMLKMGLYKGKQDIYSTEFRIIKFPRLNYSAKMIIKR